MAEIEPRRAELALPLVRRGVDSPGEESVEDAAGPLEAEETDHVNPGLIQGLVTVPFWEYWTSPYSSHYRPYT